MLLIPVVALTTGRASADLAGAQFSTVAGARGNLGGWDPINRREVMSEVWVSHRCTRPSRRGSPVVNSGASGQVFDRVPWRRSPGLEVVKVKKSGVSSAMSVIH